MKADVQRAAAVHDDVAPVHEQVGLGLRIAPLRRLREHVLRVDPAAARLAPDVPELPVAAARPRGGPAGRVPHRGRERDVRVPLAVHREARVLEASGGPRHLVEAPAAAAVGGDPVPPARREDVDLVVAAHGDVRARVVGPPGDAGVADRVPGPHAVDVREAAIDHGLPGGPREVHHARARLDRDVRAAALRAGPADAQGLAVPREGARLRVGSGAAVHHACADPRAAAVQPGHVKGSRDVAHDLGRAVGRGRVVVARHADRRLPVWEHVHVLRPRGADRALARRALPRRPRHARGPERQGVGAVVGNLGAPG